MNLSHPKNLETLRGECDKLGTRIARLAFIRATLFVIFVFSLASAFQKISSSDASGIVESIRELMVITKDRPQLDTFLTATYFPYGGDVQPAELEPDTDADEEFLSPEEEEARSARREQARKEQADLTARLTTIADEAFYLAFKAPLLGTEIKVDLRVWGFILLVCFILWEVHLFVQRHKLRTLQRIAGIVAANAPGEATILDDLFFRWDGRHPAAFVRHPAQFEFVASMIGGLALIVYLGIAGHDYWEGTDPFSKRQLVELYAFVIVYAVAYGAYVKRQIDAEAALVEGFNPIIGYLSRAMTFARSRLSVYARRLWPEVNLVTGSVMVVGTLGLLVGAPTCSPPHPGWSYLQKPDGWLVGPMSGLNAGGEWHNVLIATLYGIGLAIAGLTLVMLLVSVLRRKRLRAGGISLYLATGTTVLTLFFLTELTFGTILDMSFFGVPGLILWLIPGWIWWRYWRSKQRSLPADWLRVRRTLFYWFAPQAAVGAIVSVGTLFERHPLVGVPVFVCGLAVLARGYWNARALAGAREFSKQ